VLTPHGIRSSTRASTQTLLPLQAYWSPPLSDEMSGLKLLENLAGAVAARTGDGPA
jgi:hypothetical protein